MKYEHIFFDLDRTLWDYDANSFQALKMIFEEFKLDQYFRSTEEFYLLFNIQNDQLWEDYRQGSLKKAELRSLRFFRTLLEKGVNNMQLSGRIGKRYMFIIPRLNNLIPGTTDLLEYLLEKRYKLYILTNGFIQTQRRKMENSNIDRFFIHQFSSEEIGTNKPGKDIFHWAVSSVHAKKSSCLMVGDDLKVDIKGAMNYGIDAAWFNPSDVESDFEPSYVIKDLIELQNIL